LSFANSGIKFWVELAYLNVAFAGEVDRAVTMINLLISIRIERRAAVIAAIAISEKRQTLQSLGPTDREEGQTAKHRST
jgi:hypothetical protein